MDTRLPKCVSLYSVPRTLSQGIILEKVEASFETLRWAPDEVLVLCLGLGSPMESKSAAAQLVFISSICETLNIVGPDALVIDSVVNIFSSLPTE
jgi:SRR1 domain